jgi:hypothetical protein
MGPGASLKHFTPQASGAGPGQRLPPRHRTSGWNLGIGPNHGT